MFTKNRRKTRTRLPRNNQRPSHVRARSLRSDGARPEAWSLRSDRTRTRLSRHVATKLSPKLGRYITTEHVHGSVAT
ncbi:hypothetical protein DY000_02032233 [Brassica cretica]|uniref:Uncharacterized protein n=1 Tax=Brassica cretica TaxID=69181 RepID=A0ABQ7DPA9_BRACR|nr:hypothetical protein DY000_02032233 [Brassica cretica]